MDEKIKEHAISAIVGLAAFFGVRFFKKADKYGEDIGKLQLQIAILEANKSDSGALRERIGQLEMQIKAAFRQIDDQKEYIKELREDIRTLNASE